MGNCGPPSGSMVALCHLRVQPRRSRRGCSVWSVHDRLHKLGGRSKRIQGLLGILAVAVLVPLAVAAGGRDGNAGVDPAGGDAALRRDAASYAEDFDVSVEEALKRLRLQSEIGELDAKVAVEDASTFGGLWIQHVPDYKVKVAFTENASSKLAGYDVTDGLRENLQAVPVSVSLATLLETQANAVAAAERVSQVVESSVQVVDGQVELYTTDEAALRRALTDGGESIPDHVVLVEVDSHSVPEHADDNQLHAGLFMYDCSAGFSVVHDNGTRGITTAGHCANTGQWVDLVALDRPEGERNSGRRDVQWHVVEDDEEDDGDEGEEYTFRNLLYDGSSHRYIYSTKSRSAQSIGEYVCKYGKATYKTCGNIDSKTFQRVSPWNVSRWIRVHKDWRGPVSARR